MKKYDLVVLGGGFAGAAAAISAGREGLSVLLIDLSNALGGSATNCLVNPFMGNGTKVNGEWMQLSKGLIEEIIHGMKEFSSDYLKHGAFNEEYLKIVLNRKALDAGVEFLFHSMLIDVCADNGRINSVRVANKSGQMDIFADFFIDATGDADLAVMAGFPYRLGREKDNLCQPMTLCFRVAKVDMEKFDKEWASFNSLYNQFRQEGKIKNPRENVLVFKTTIDGIIQFNSTRIVKLDPTNAFDVTKAEIEAREQMVELFEFMRDNFEAFAESELLSSAAWIGVRESRMIDGEYILTGQDLVACKKFDDNIASGNYDIDIHNPEGTGTSHYYFPPGEFYTIPYRTLIPKGAENLLVAGRCISVDHEAQASIRIMQIVCCLGEAAGLAMSIAKKSDCNVKDIDIGKLQELLKSKGAFIYEK